MILLKMTIFYFFTNIQNCMMHTIARFLVLFISALSALQLFFILRIVIAQIIPLHSTAFERTQILQLIFTESLSDWQHKWIPYKNISTNLKQAVIAAEDSRFSSHYGIEWQAILQARRHNQRSQSTGRTGAIRGGSTITQQLAKNLFLSSEQNYLRKAQELIITYSLETFLSKEQLLELYLNHSQWGQGVFGAEAASQKYFLISAKDINQPYAARLAAMLPNPMYYERNRNSRYLQQRAKQIMQGMPIVKIP